MSLPWSPWAMVTERPMHLSQKTLVIYFTGERALKMHPGAMFSHSTTVYFVWRTLSLCWPRCLSFQNFPVPSRWCILYVHPPSTILVCPFPSTILVCLFCNGLQQKPVLFLHVFGILNKGGRREKPIFSPTILFRIKMNSWNSHCSRHTLRCLFNSQRLLTGLPYVKSRYLGIHIYKWAQWMEPGVDSWHKLGQWNLELKFISVFHTRSVPNNNKNIIKSPELCFGYLPPDGSRKVFLQI